MRVRRCSFSTAWVIKTRLSQTMGVELPRSGSGMRQRTFWFVPHRSGRSWAGAIPFPEGPRHAGQLAANAGMADKASSPAAEPIHRMASL